jgi:hypothetical protein
VSSLASLGLFKPTRLLLKSVRRDKLLNSAACHDFTLLEISKGVRCGDVQTVERSWQISRVADWASHGTVAPVENPRGGVILRRARRRAGFGALHEMIRSGAKSANPQTMVALIADLPPNSIVEPAA